MEQINDEQKFQLYKQVEIYLKKDNNSYIFVREQVFL